MEKKVKRMIPHEVILLEILPKLPVKSLYRFKSVSKLWNSTISTDPSFLKAQFTHSSSTGLTLLITFQDNFGEKTSFVLSVKVGPNNEAQTQSDYEFTRPRGNFFLSPYLRGLNLIHLKSPESLLVANTATHQFVTLPPPGQEELPHRHLNSFGFDPVRSQHKVLNTRVIHTDYPNNKDKVRVEHRVLSLSQSQAQWRRLNDVPTHIPVSHYKSICIDGLVYYMAMIPDASSSDDRQYIIVEFDVSREKFDFIELPPLLDSYVWRVEMCQFIDYCNGKLGLVEG